MIFSILTDESLEEAERAQVAVFVHFVDSFTYETTEEYVCIRKLYTPETAKTLMVKLEQMFINKNIDSVLDFLV